MEGSAERKRGGGENPLMQTDHRHRVRTIAYTISVRFSIFVLVKLHSSNFLVVSRIDFLYICNMASDVLTYQTFRLDASCHNTKSSADDVLQNKYMYL